jgi:preprotein translocase subunit YajC
MASTPGQSPLAGLVPVLLMVAIFYFLLIAPVRKRQRQHDDLLSNLKNGDKIVTSGGVIGTVVGIQEDRVRLKVADQVKIEVTKQSVAGLVDSGD